MSERKNPEKSNDYKTLFTECVKLLVATIELLIVVVGLFLLFKGGFK